MARLPRRSDGRRIFTAAFKREQIAALELPRVKLDALKSRRLAPGVSGR